MPSNTESFAIFSAAGKRARKVRRSIRSVTALSGGLAALLIATPAFAQQGGAGGSGGFGGGGAGGGAGQPGGTATCSIIPVAACQTTGGAAGTDPGGDGADGNVNSGGPGGGGGGGANGSLATPTGGNGGNGGNGQAGNYSTGGGGGGSGGNGVILTGPLTNSATVAGGNGGNGGAAGATFFSGGPANGGAGGDGGTGIVASAGAVITNLSAGSITGGAGGLGGAGSNGGGLAGAGGAGGTGIRGADITVENAGSIAGGTGGDGVTRGYALHFTGGSNTLGLLAGWNITGGIQLDSGSSLSFDVGGTETLGNVISGAGSIAKTGAGTLILTGTNSYSGSTALNGGTLQIDDPASIGGGPIEFNTGTLRTNFDGTLGNNLFWNDGATGTLAAATGTTLTLTGTLNYGGDTEVRFGSAADTGTIIASFSTGSVSGGPPKQAIFGGGIFRAGTGFMSLALANFTSVQIDAGATLDINGVQPVTTLQSLQGAGTLQNDGAETLIYGGDFAGTVTGTQNIRKAGIGTLILSGDNDYSGSTVIDGGVLQIGAGGSSATSGTLGTGNVTIASGASLVFARADAHSVSNAIDGDGSVEQAGPGVLELTGANSYTGSTRITGGLISFTGSGNFGSGNITLNGGGLQWAAGTTTDISARLDPIGSAGGVFDTNGNNVLLMSALSGSGLTKAGSGTLTLAGSNSFTGTITINDGTLLQSNANALAGADIVLGGGTLDIGNYDLALGQALSITGTGTIESSGTGALTTVAGESAVFGSTGGAIASDLEITVASGSTLSLFGNNALTGTIVVNGKLVIGETGAAGASNNTIGTVGPASSVISFADGVDNAPTILLASNAMQLEVLGTDVATQSGAITGIASGFGFEKIGSGTLNITAVNAYDGTTLVTGGTLAFNQQGLSFSQLIAIDNGAAVRLLEDVDHDGGVTILANGGTIDTDIYRFTVSGAVDYQGELTKTGSGTLELRDENDTGTGAGGINVIAGTLALGSDTAAGTGTIKLADATTLLNASCGCAPLTLTNAIQVALGGTATIDADGYETVLAGTITGGNLIFADSYGGGTTRLTGTNSYGNTAVGLGATLIVGDGGTAGTLGTGTITTDGMLAFDRSDSVTLATAVGGSGLLGQFGTGTLILTAGNSYSGGTLILNPTGTIQVGDGGTTGTLGTGDIVIGGGTLIFNRSDDLVVADQIAGDGLITKLGAGTLTLNGDNLNGLSGPYVGAISVQAGTLAVGEFGLGASQMVEIDNGATLKAIKNAYAGDMTILSGGGTIDTGAFTFELLGSIDFQGELTKIGSGTLLIDDTFEEGLGAGGINVTAGTLGLGSDYAGGTGLIKLADGTTLLNAACGCTRLDIDNDIQVALGGAATFDGGGNNTDLNGAISGGDVHFTTSLSAPFAGSIFRLNGANGYGATQIGPNVALIVYDGTLGTGNVTFDAVPSDPTTPAALVFQNDTDYSYGGKIIGAGIVSIETDSNASVTLTGSNSATENFTGAVEVLSGRLVINGSFGDVVNNSATMLIDDSCFCGGTAPSLGGSGIFHGSVTLGNTELNPGNSPGTLVIAGNLTLGAGTILNFELGEPGTPGGANNDLVTVGGNLTLDGTLNTMAWGAGYGPGYYRLFNYGGTLTDNELLIGSIAGGLDATVLTNINGQVNVRLGGAQAVQYWDGSDAGASAAAGGNGGSGTWHAANTNWTGPTGYAINDSWKSQVGVFAGAAGGTVTVEGTQAFEELRFETDGYVLSPSDASARLNTTGGFSIIDVTSGITADIGVIIQGGAGLNKTGAGTLILSAANTYSGATDVAAGTLRLGINQAIQEQSALNVQAGGTFDLDGFQTKIGSIAGAGAITLGGGRLDTGYNNVSTLFSGTVTGADGSESTFTKNGNGTLSLAGSIALGNGGGALKSFAQVNAGTLEITGTGSLSADLIQNFSMIENSGTITAFVTFQTFGTVVNAATGVINGQTQNFGSFDNYGTMSGLQSLGGTAVNHGTGVINGNVQTFSSFASTGIINGALGNFGTATIQNQVNGELSNQQVGATITFSGTVTGITNYFGSSGTLLDLAGFDTTIGALNGNGGTVQLGAARLTVNNAAFSTFDGVVTGSGGLTKTGMGELRLNGASDYSGTTLISGGILVLGEGGAIGAGTVTNNAALGFDGALDRTFANAIQGNGALVKTGSGLLVLTGTNGSFSGTVDVQGGALGFDNAQALGSGAVTLGSGTFLRNLQGVTAITLANAIQGTGTVTLQGVDGANTTFGGAISGGTVRFGLSGGGATAFTLAAANSYGDTRIGGGVALTVGAGGTLGTGDTVFEANPIPSSLTFANATNYSYAGVISGSGSIVVDAVAGASVTLTGSNGNGTDFTGAVTVDAGKLVINGAFGDVANNAASLTLNGGTLAGSGTFHGDVSIGNAALNPGNSPGTLNIGGSLTLGSGTILSFELGEAGTVGGANNDLVNIGGNLTLDGTLNVLAQPSFGEGYYRLFNYGGTLTDNGLALGALPAGYTPTLLTNIAGQVNILFASSPQAIQYWDGSDLTGASTATGGDGGAGIWSTGGTNWTAPTGYGVNDAWRGQVAVFGGGAGGTVTVQGTQAFQELRFTTSDYVIAGATAADGLATTGGFSVIDVSGGVSATIAAAISGAGGLTKTGTGTLNLGGANSYAGTTTVTAGQLKLLAGGSLAGGVVNQAIFTNAGTVTGAVQNDATLTSTGTLAGGLANNGTATLAGTVGTGIVNNGAVSFSGTATVAALQQAAAGTFDLAGFGVSLGTLTGSGAITLGGGALSVGTGNGNSSFAGTISGAGSLTKAGTGTLVLTGTAAPTGGTTIAGGTLQIGAGGTTGSLSGAIANSGVLILNRSDAVTFANAMSGTGGFVQAGSGTTTLTGANSYGGGTIVAAGRLRGDTASLQGAIRIDSALEFAQSGAGTYAGSLSGAGLLEKSGTGNLSFTGDSSAFTGATSVLAGRLAINGLLSRSIVTVGNGATLGGTGTVGGLVVQSGATIAPGNSVGTLNVAGNVLFQAGSLFAAEVQASGADRIQASGSATLNGTLQILNLGGNYAMNSSFVLLHADSGVSGTFTVSGLNSFGLAFRPKIIYTANEVQLFLAPNQLSAVLGTGVPLSYNQLSTITRLDTSVMSGNYDPTPLSALYSLAPAAIPAALDQLSGEIYADATRAALEDERIVREAVVGRLAAAADAGLSGNGGWGQVIGSWGSVDGDGNAAGYDVERTGMILGMDAGAATEDGSWRAGLMGHYTRITVPATARGSRATIDRTGGGFYAGAAIGGWRFRAGASLALLDLKARRQIAVPGFTASERGKVQGVMLQTLAELSYRIETGAHGFVEPYLAGSVSRVRFGRFAETSGPVALIVRDQKSVLGIAELGLRGEIPLAGGDTGGVRLGGNVGLRTAFGDRAANPLIALTAAADQAFTVRSAEIDRFAAAANLNLIVDLSDKLDLRIGYSGMLGSGVREHGGRATLSLKF